MIRPLQLAVDFHEWGAEAHGSWGRKSLTHPALDSKLFQCFVLIALAARVARHLMRDADSG